MNSIRSGNAAVQKCEKRQTFRRNRYDLLVFLYSNNNMTQHLLDQLKVIKWGLWERMSDLVGGIVANICIFSCYKQVSRLKIARNKHSAEYRRCIRVRYLINTYSWTVAQNCAFLLGCFEVATLFLWGVLEEIEKANTAQSCKVPRRFFCHCMKKLNLPKLRSKIFIIRHYDS
jgi:hypothetical protein